MDRKTPGVPENIALGLDTLVGNCRGHSHTYRTDGMVRTLGTGWHYRS